MDVKVESEQDSGKDTAINMDQGAPDTHLEDDRPPQEGQFIGATLQIGAEQPRSEPEVEFAGQGLNRNRPGSTIGRQSVQSTSSRTSMKPGQFRTEKMKEMFFCNKENSVDKAVEFLKREHVKPDLDGSVVGSWLLSEIDHWDNEREKLVLLCENTVLVFRYNFINDKMEYMKRISLHIIDTICCGDFHYPEWSLMPSVSSDRQHGGIQIKWNHGTDTSFGQRWNPWCVTIPWLTFCHHPLIYCPNENETVTYNVDDFYESLIQSVSKAFNRKRPGEKVTVIEGPIVIESYASLSSVVFNQSNLGFCKDRNGLAF